MPFLAHGEGLGSDCGPRRPRNVPAQSEHRERGESDRFRRFHASIGEMMRRGRWRASGNNNGYASIESRQQPDSLSRNECADKRAERERERSFAPVRNARRHQNDGKGPLNTREERKGCLSDLERDRQRQIVHNKLNRSCEKRNSDQHSEPDERDDKARQFYLLLPDPTSCRLGCRAA